MKRFLIITTMVVIIMSLTTCDLFSKKGPLEGVHIYASMGDDLGTSRNINSRADDGDDTYHIPQSASIAVTKCWLPTAASYEQLKQYTAGNEGIVLDPADGVNLADYSFYKALDREDSNPYVFSTSDSQPFTPDTSLPYDTLYKGLLLETLYWEFEMSDFSIRWYQRDSGDNKRGDVKINDGNGWKWAYLQRSMPIKFTAIDVPNNAYDQITGHPTTLADMTVEVILSESRIPATGAYFENWIGAHRVDPPDQQYIYNALTTYKYSGDTSLFSWLKNESKIAGEDPGNPGSYTEIDYTLKQYYNIAGDTRMDANPGDFAVGVNPLTQWPEVGTYTHPGAWDRGLHPFAFITMGGGNEDVDHPKEIQTFTEKANEARFWLFQIDYGFHCESDGYTGLCFSAYNKTLPAPTWANIKNLQYFLSLAPIASGIEVKIGWEDFNGDLQGEFSPDANQ